MKKITEKLREQIIRDLTPLAEQLRREGATDAEIGRTLRRHQDCKIKDFYNSQKSVMQSIGEHAKSVIAGIKADSRIEKVFYDALVKHNIPFQFQSKIGPYRVDYLIGGVIVFEGDGPQHAAQIAQDRKRDKYLNDMGYIVFRMRWELVAMISETVIAEIKAELSKHKILERESA